MTDRTPPASRPELVDQYRAAAQRCDWQGMLVATQELAARAEYDVAMAIRQAQQNLDWARTRLEAAQTERSVARQALADARERAPLADEQASLVADLRTRAATTATATAAYWRTEIPLRERTLLAAEGRFQDADRIALDAQANVERLLAAAYARVQPSAKEETKA